MIFRRVPPPARSGATATRAWARYGRTSATVPETSTDPQARARTAGVGSLPTSRSRASGRRRSPRARLPRRATAPASTLGAQPMVATKATVGSRRGQRAARVGVPAVGTDQDVRDPGGQPAALPLAHHRPRGRTPAAGRAPCAAARPPRRGRGARPGPARRGHSCPPGPTPRCGGRGRVVRGDSRATAPSAGTRPAAGRRAPPRRRVAPRRPARCSRTGRPRRCASAAPPPGARRGEPPRDATHVDAETPEPGHVGVAVVVGAQHDVGQLGQAAGDRQRALLAAVVVGQRQELRDHEHPHGVPPDPTGDRCRGLAVHPGDDVGPGLDAATLGRGASALGEPTAQLVVGDQAVEGLGQGVGVAARDRQPVSPSETNSGMPPARVPITATPAGLGLEDAEPEGLGHRALTSTSRARRTPGTSFMRPTKRTRSPKDALGLGPHPLGVAVGGEPAHFPPRPDGAPAAAPWSMPMARTSTSDALLGIDAAHDPHQRRCSSEAEVPARRGDGRSGAEALEVDRQRHDAHVASAPGPDAVGDGLADGHRRGRQRRRGREHRAAQPGTDEVVELDDRRRRRDSRPASAQSRCAHKLLECTRSKSRAARAIMAHRSRRGEELASGLPGRRPALGIGGRAARGVRGSRAPQGEAETSPVLLEVAPGGRGQGEVDARARPGDRPGPWWRARPPTPGGSSSPRGRAGAWGQPRCALSAARSSSAVGRSPRRYRTTPPKATA